MTLVRRPPPPSTTIAQTSSAQTSTPSQTASASTASTSTSTSTLPPAPRAGGRVDVPAGAGASSLVSVRTGAMTPWQLRPQRSAHFVSVDATSFAPPTVTHGAVDPTLQFPPGTQVRARIHGKDVDGVVVGFDAKGRAVLDAHGTRRVCAHSELSVVAAAPLRKSVMAALPASAVVAPPAVLKSALDACLDLTVNGTHSAREYVDAFRARGFEVFIVGGGVRDAIRVHAQNPNASQSDLLATLLDVDIVTTAPPPVARRICEEIAPELKDGGVWSPRFVEQFGVVLAGGKKAGQANSDGLDICAMKRGGSTSEMVTDPDTGERGFPTSFGHNLELDTLGRDFCCNALYFDPAHGVVVDPTLQGIADAEHALLHPVTMPTNAAPGDPSICARFWKFRLRGYTSDGETLAALRHNARAVFSTQSGKERWQLQNVLGRTAPKDASSRAAVDKWLVDLRRVMFDDRCADLYDRSIKGGVREGIISEVLKRTNKGATSTTMTTSTSTSTSTSTTTSAGGGT